MMERALLILAVWGCLLLSQIGEMYYAAYHRFSETPAMAVVGGLLASLILVAPAVLAAVLLPTRFVIRLLAGLLVLYAAHRLIAVQMPDLFRVVGVEAAFILLGGILLVLCLRYVSSPGWMRIARAMLAVAIGWGLSLPVGAWFKAGVEPVPSLTLSTARILAPSPRAVAILILDEAAMKSAERFQAALEAVPGQKAYSAVSESAGSSTVFAIPSMLVDKRHDDVIPCGVTQLCGSVSFNMKNLQASQADVDIVGTFHPYCAIRGLRSCWTAQVTNPDAPDVDRGLLRAVGRRLPFIASFLDVDPDEVAAMHYEREGVANRAFQAPFWKEGGVLYVHHLLPHPTGWSNWGNRVHDLSKEYKVNIVEAAQFIGIFNTRLRDRFGLDYALIVTTDHSLRTRLWCTKPYFRTPTCLTDNPPNSSRIPFLVLAPDSAKVTLPTTNVGIFAPLPEDS